MTGAELTRQRRDELIEGIARRVVQWGLETPAALFLEMHRPLSLIAGQSLLVAIPFLGALFDARSIADLAALLRRPDNVGLLVDRIELLAAARGRARAASSGGSE
jgi:hypothetical protein